MKKGSFFLMLLCLVLALSACRAKEKPTILVPKAENLAGDFIMGADVSTLLTQEASGVVSYDFDGQQQDLLKVLHDAGVNYIRVRVWNDPFDAAGNGYGGGNCTVDTAIEIGKRAARYDMGLLVDFHYSDFWADPSKQQAPKAWEALSLEEKEQAIYDYTVEQDITGLRAGNYTFSIQVQGGDVNEDAQMYIYVISDGQRYEQPFLVDGWVNWQNSVIENIPCTSGSMTIGVCVQAAGGVWGTMDHFLLNPAQ